MRVKTPGASHANWFTFRRQISKKVIIGRWLLTQPEILMLDEPTRGIDVGAKFEIYQLIAELAKKGKGIIIISSEMPELLGITDRILVMSNGLVSGIVDTKNNNAKRNFASCFFAPLRSGAPYECVKQEKLFDLAERGRNFTSFF
ncbi:galactoside transport ATP-binding protein [Salmonella enterica subsp. enterica]|uniref:Ribose/galactose/methyl galactoside import ATP-binding protein n=1 Tax=Salmonella enterica I TaxID=59201 RepID=A0A3S4IJ54_SALET|nr:galactoside transport ATP-binding protein [Salmonella enterica subsp. enterica]